jgi:hypothetical protein
MNLSNIDIENLRYFVYHIDKFRYFAISLFRYLK